MNDRAQIRTAMDSEKAKAREHTIRHGITQDQVIDNQRRRIRELEQENAKLHRKILHMGNNRDKLKKSMLIDEDYKKLTEWHRESIRLIRRISNGES